MTNLRPDENVLVGKWIIVNGAVEGDETCKRIDELTRGSLVLVATTDGGWTKLFKDRADGRFWEHTYPESEWHGGGPSTLTHVSADYVKSKYQTDR